VETIGALVDRYGDWHLTIGRRQQLKKWTQCNSESQQKLAVPSDRRLIVHEQHGIRDTAIRD
jgi:hypothetical protein